MGGRVLWLFAYTETGATGSADLLVQGGLIRLISWSYVPAGSGGTVPVPEEPVVAAESTPPVALVDLWGAGPGIGVLVVFGLGYRLRQSDRTPAPPGREGRLLCALRASKRDRFRIDNAD
jgi:hypothetical protein